MMKLTFADYLLTIVKIAIRADAGIIIRNIINP